VPRYKHELGHERVYFLPFAAQPAIHNPIEEYERKDAFNFAGSYYLRYPERQRDFESLITAVNELKPLEIYDRNYNKTHPHYQFPDSYKKYILGNLPFNEISKAYKGYKYGINLNTIKQSQSMFARRVYELLASNTVVASNFSRGMRLMFGDLVVSSDNVGQLKESLQGIIDDDLTYRKLRLLGLRKVMKEHTYSHRLRFITSKLQDIEFLNPKSKILVLSICRSTQEIERTIECFKKQKEIDAILYIYADHASEKTNEVNIKIFSSKEKFLESIKEILPKNDFIGCFSPQDYYAESYLLDLSLGSMYSNAGAFGKAAYFAAESDTTTLINDGSQYKPANVLLTRRAITRTREITSSWIDEFLKNPESHQITYNEMIATDELNYIENGANLPEGIKVNYQDMILLDKGIALTRMNDISEKLSYIPNEKAANGDNLIILDAVELRSSISGNNTVNVALKDGEMHITSLLSAGSHQYLYAKTYKSREDFNLLLNSQFQLHCDRQLDLRTVFEFLDATGKKISHQINPAGTKGVLAIPNHCTSIRFGLRVEGHGDATIKRLVLGAEPERPATVICKSPYLVLTKQYPAYNDLYKYGFLHSRIRAYKKADLAPDIFCIRNKGLGFREFQGVDIAVGDAELLDATLATGEIKHVLVHLLDEIMWRILQKYVDKIRVTVWVHGAEIQLWQRRQFEFTLMNDTEIERQKKLSDKRKKFWREILPNPPTNLHFVFVSNYLKSEAETDLSVIIPNKNHSIIHNFIDNVAFSCRGKNMEDRLKILSIRPYSKLVYANDLSVAAINELSTRPFFNHLEITLVGDGELFDDNIAPLRKFKNVTIEKRFLNQAEIAKYHSKNGVFLIPTRMDTQGVSRDEAMSSGLVPVTNNVAAIPEFLDASCGLVVPAEDHIAIADAIEHLYSNPMEFLQLSEAAAKRVREQCGFNQTIAKEMDLIRS
jgi:glycosyltransferase involved in cell wall biosynthesis